ncbi:MAG: hypothetical protein LWY06_15545 [Firmicutes bacterium]|nr:hypothetical protein [Bacillota bacterium]
MFHSEWDKQQFMRNAGCCLFVIIAFFTGIFIWFFIINPGRLYNDCKRNMSRIGATLKIYAADNEGNYPTALNMLNTSGMGTIPSCNSSGHDSYSPSYQYYNNSKDKIHRYTFYCSGYNHSRYIMFENYPQYTSEKGLIAR